MRATSFISAVIVLSPDPERLARFYSEGLGVHLNPSSHGGGPLHFECDLGDVHFAIHPDPEAQANPSAPSGRKIKIAFAVADLTELLSGLRSSGVDPIYQPVERGFATIAAVLDPDGNTVELTQLSDRWLDYLASRATLTRDVVLNMRGTDDQNPLVKDVGGGTRRD